MKTRMLFSHGTKSYPASLSQRSKRLFSSLLSVAILTMTGVKARSDDSFVAHEWGTFPSVQGSDSVLLDWRLLETTHLPKLVYDWTKPGLNRRAAGALGSGKRSLVTLQRMETPVIYFYTDRKQTIDLSVRFPKGLITEWYPQAREIGPSMVPPHPAFVALDDGLRKSGLPPHFSFVSVFGNPGIKDSIIHWKNFQILPADKNQNAAGLLPRDTSGSHYFVARETDAAFVRVNSLAKTNPTPELEKFLFYRGVGSFATPLKVTMKSDAEVALENTGKDNLTHLFILRVQGPQARFIYVDQLQSGGRQAIQDSLKTQMLPLDQVGKEISNAMVESLVKEGLYRREAIAMVNTWKDAWFAEEGLRVLYVLPRAWTDQTLPIKLDPQPHELIRVMVGRAELLTPDAEKRLTEKLSLSSGGDQQAQEQAVAELKAFGRFAEAALRRVTDPKANQTGRALLQFVTDDPGKQGGS